MFTIDNSFSNANVAKTIRFTEDLERKLSAVASAEHISYNELVLRCCKYALDEYEGKIDIHNVGIQSND
ncbi:MAG: hypothetical protein ACI4FY_11975 [Acetatifactor sp.]